MKIQNEGRLISSQVDRHVVKTISDNTFGSCHVDILTTPGNENLYTGITYTWGHTDQTNLQNGVRRSKTETCDDQK